MPKTTEPDPRTAYRTGPNVDIGLEPGAVTVDPQTAAGVAAEAARKANGAKSKMTDDGVEEVHAEKGGSPFVEDISGPAPLDAPAVDKKSAVAKKDNPSTIGNTPDDIKADPKADVQ